MWFPRVKPPTHLDKGAGDLGTTFGSILDVWDNIYECRGSEGQPASGGLQPTSGSLQPTNDGLQLLAVASNLLY